jgi:8-oxo-dGTP pyrophosphatase MutT (NUDIX family)
MTSSRGYLRHFHACNRHDLAKFVPFYIGGKKLGWVTKELAARLPHEMDFFAPLKDGIMLAAPLDDFTARSEALAKAAMWISERYNRPLRHEMYPVIENWGDQSLAQIDRAAVPWFGVKGFGVHVNGFTRKKDGLHLWIGERAADRLVDPGKLDNMIGGGQPIGLTIEENLIKEAGEEAGIGPALARTAKPVRTISYLVERMHGLRNDVLFVFDLELPENFVPRNTDGEVAAFHLMPLPEVAALVFETDRFKFNCNLVVTDFLIRHGFIGKEDGEYEEIKDFLKD